MKGLAYIDRGAVLFVGIAVGAVLLYSFQHDGKVLEPLFVSGNAPLASPAVAAAVPGPACPSRQRTRRRPRTPPASRRPIRPDAPMISPLAPRDGGFA
jgi:hypothetical protein